VARPTEDVLADPAVVTAVKTLLTAISASSAMKIGAGSGLTHVRQQVASTRKPSDLSVDPSTSASGIRIVNEFPDGIHFNNFYRRTAKAFVDQISHVPLGGGPAITDHAPDSSGTVVDIESVAKTDGLARTVGDILIGKLAYTPFDTPTMPLPSIADAQSTLSEILGQT